MQEFKPIKAREMPNFTKIQMKPKKSNVELTEPTGFMLESEKRRIKAEAERFIRMESERDQEERRRKFKAQQVPDYEKM